MAKKKTIKYQNGGRLFDANIHQNNPNLKKIPFDINYQQTGPQSATWQLPGPYASPERKSQAQFVRDEFNRIGTAKPYTVEYPEMTVHSNPGKIKKEQTKAASQFNKQITDIQKIIGYDNKGDVLSSQGLADFRKAYSNKEISYPKFNEYYENILKHYDKNVANINSKDHEELKKIWYGDGRWMDNPLNVAKVAATVAKNAPLIAGGFAAIPSGTIGRGVTNALTKTVKGLQTPAVIGGRTIPALTADKLFWSYMGADAINRTPSLISNTAKGKWSEAAGDAGHIALDLLFNPALKEVAPLFKEAKALTTNFAKSIPSYEQIATGNSRLPYAWKVEKAKQLNETAQTLLKNKRNLTSDEARVLAKYLENPGGLGRGKDSETFSRLIKENNADFSSFDFPITKIDKYFSPKKDHFSTKYGSKIEFPDTRSWSTGIQHSHLDNTGRTRLIIPSKYSKDLDAFAVPYKSPKLREAITEELRQLDILQNKSGAEGLKLLDKTRPNRVRRKLEGLKTEQEIIGNVPEGFKVIGKSKEGGFDNLIIKPIKSSKPKVTKGNWNKPTKEYLEAEYLREIEHKGLGDLISKEEFIKQGMKQLPKKIEDASALDYRSFHGTKEDIISQSKEYASWPKYRNEKTIDDIYTGFGEGKPMDAPIIMRMPNGRMRIVAGNTRLNVAEQLGIDSHAITIDAKPVFKSEINWGKWNKEIPTNKKLMKEYHAIEESAKAEGIWMKNSDGSAFKGTPEQFVQQHSANFKKAFPEGFESVWRGVGDPGINPLRSKNPYGKLDINTPTDYRDKYTGIFTGDENLAYAYTPSGVKPLNLAMKKSPNSLQIEGLGNWHGDLNTIGSSKKILKKNIDNLRKELGVSSSKEIPREKFNYNSASSQPARLESYENFYNNYDEIVNNPIYKKLVKYKKKQEKLDKHLSETSFNTDDLAKFLEKEGLDNIQLNFIDDGGMGRVNISNQVPGNYLKSLEGNSGMFDMTNPNIYKSLIPAAIGAGAIQQKYGGNMFEQGGNISTMGYRDDSPYNNASSLDIYSPTGEIDMGTPGDGTGKDILANGQYLPAYSGKHQVPVGQDGIVKEVPLDKVDPNKILQYLINKGISKNHALGMVNNILYESGFNSGIPGDKGTSIGLFQHHAERKDALLEYIGGVENLSNWEKQIDYALSENDTQEYLKQNFKSPKEASMWFTLNWERPQDKEQKAIERLQGLKNYKDGRYVSNYKTYLTSPNKELSPKEVKEYYESPIRIKETPKKIISSGLKDIYYKNIKDTNNEVMKKKQTNPNNILYWPPNQKKYGGNIHQMDPNMNFLTFDPNDPNNMDYTSHNNNNPWSTNDVNTLATNPVETINTGGDPRSLMPMQQMDMSSGGFGDLGYTDYVKMGAAVGNTIGQLTSDTSKSPEQKKQQDAQAITQGVNTVSGTIFPWLAAAYAGQELATGLVVDQNIDPETGVQYSTDKGWTKGVGKEAEEAFKPTHQRSIEKAAEGDTLGAVGEYLLPGIAPWIDNAMGDARKEENKIAAQGMAKWGGNIHQINPNIKTAPYNPGVPYNFKKELKDYKGNPQIKGIPQHGGDYRLMTPAERNAKITELEKLTAPFSPHDVKTYQELISGTSIYTDKNNSNPWDKTLTEPIDMSSFISSTTTATAPPVSIGPPAMLDANTGQPLPIDRHPIESGQQVNRQYSQYLEQFANSPGQREKRENAQNQINTNTGLIKTMTPEQLQEMRNQGVTPSKYLNTSNSQAYGGNMFPMGAQMSSNQMGDVPVTEFNTGGTHAENPYGGIPQGRGANGKVNLVEKGELKIPDPRDPSGQAQFVVSAQKDLKVTKKIAEEFGLPKKYIGHPVLYVANDILRKESRRENDSIENTSIQGIPGKNNGILHDFMAAHEALTEQKKIKENANFTKDLESVAQKYPTQFQELQEQTSGQSNMPQQGPPPEEMGMMHQQGQGAPQQGMAPQGPPMMAKYGGYMQYLNGGNIHQINSNLNNSGIHFNTSEEYDRYSDSLINNAMGISGNTGYDLNASERDVLNARYGKSGLFDNINNNPVKGEFGVGVNSGALENAGSMTMPASYQMGGGMPQQQEQGQGQEIVQQVAQALQQGANPKEVATQLVQSGMLGEEEAVQLVQGVMQQLQGGGQGQQMANGGNIHQIETNLNSIKTMVDNTALSPVTTSNSNFTPEVLDIKERPMFTPRNNSIHTNFGNRIPTSAARDNTNVNINSIQPPKFDYSNAFPGKFPSNYLSTKYGNVHQYDPNLWQAPTTTDPRLSHMQPWNSSDFVDNLYKSTEGLQEEAQTKTQKKGTNKKLPGADRPVTKDQAIASEGYYDPLTSDINRYGSEVPEVKQKEREQSALNFAGQLAPIAASFINMGDKNLKKEAKVRDPKRVKLERASYEQLLRDAGYSANAARKAIKSGAGNAGTYLGNVLALKNREDLTKGRIHEGVREFNKGISAQEASLNLNVDKINAENDWRRFMAAQGNAAQKRAYLAQGAGSVAGLMQREEQTGVTADYIDATSKDFDYNYRSFLDRFGK